MVRPHGEALQASAGMTEIEVARPAEVILPTGEIVDMSDPASLAQAYEKVREIEQTLREIRGFIIEGVAAYAEHRGAGKTIHLESGLKITLKGGEDIRWDAQQLEGDLREAGMDEDRIREIVIEEISYRVSANEAKKAASVNPAYAAAVERARHAAPARPTISVSRG
jgi:hypothetical protein